MARYVSSIGQCDAELSHGAGICADVRALRAVLLPQIQDMVVEPVGGALQVFAACGRASRAKLFRWQRGISLSETAEVPLLQKFNLAGKAVFTVAESDTGRVTVHHLPEDVGL